MTDQDKDIKTAQQNETMHASEGAQNSGSTLTDELTSAFSRNLDNYPTPSEKMSISSVAMPLYERVREADNIPSELYQKYKVKRGLRNADGSGVVVGITTIADVHGYKKSDDTFTPDEGRLLIRGYDIVDLVDGAVKDKRFGYEEVAYLLLSGQLPTAEQLDDFRARIGLRRQLPKGYLRAFPRTPYSHETISVMNVLQRATLLFYAFDPNPDDISQKHEIDVALSLLGRWPRVAAIAYSIFDAVGKRNEIKIPPAREDYSIAETILDILRGDKGFSYQEAQVLDIMLMLHAEHGGGNNSTFSCRVLSSSATDAYSAYAAALGSLKGPRHGGANVQVVKMVDDIAQHVKNWDNDDELASYLTKMLKGEAFDKKGLIYGLGHAVYTKSDPRAVIIKRYAHKLVQKEEQAKRLALIEAIDRLGPLLMRDVCGITKPLCANIDLYSGLVYSILDVPEELYTPFFALARLSGWAAHRMEELYVANRIIRPAYKSYLQDRDYRDLSQRTH